VTPLRGMPVDQYYEVTVPDRCFASEAAAQARKSAASAAVCTWSSGKLRDGARWRSDASSSSRAPSSPPGLCLRRPTSASPQYIAEGGDACVRRLSLPSPSRHGECLRRCSRSGHAAYLAGTQDLLGRAKYRRQGGRDPLVLVPDHLRLDPESLARPAGDKRDAREPRRGIKSLYGEARSPRPQGRPDANASKPE
jgi:hypothetical protein